MANFFTKLDDFVPFSITKPWRCKLKPQFLIKSSYYNVPSSSTALVYKPGQQWHLPISEHISYGVSNSYFEIYSVQFPSVLKLQRPKIDNITLFNKDDTLFSTMTGVFNSAGVNSRLWSAPAYQLCSTCWAEYCRSRQCYDTEKCLRAIPFTECIKEISTNTLWNHSPGKTNKLI